MKSSLLDIPPLPTATGDALGAEVARAALANNEDSGDESEDEIAPSLDATKTDEGSRSAGAATEPAQPKKSRAASGSRDTAANGTGPGETAGRVNGGPSDEKVSKRSVKRLRRDVLEDRFLTNADELALLRARNIELERKTAVVEAVGTDAIDEGVQNTVREIIELADSVTQMLVKPNVATVVKLSDKERDRLVKLGAPLVRLQLAAHVTASPWLAFAVCALSIAIGKFVAYKLASAEVTNG